ncbi:hypothetical protein C8J56DRAFT_883587 [Mycena floridula]|nr:hypothetical protein C8J56DRAFT_883587 [Mycena floridula]
MALTRPLGNYMPDFRIDSSGFVVFDLLISPLEIYEYVKTTKSVYDGQPVTVVPLSFGAFSAFFNAQANVPHKMAIYDITDRSMTIADKPPVLLTDFLEPNHPLVRYPGLARQFRVPDSEMMPAEMNLGPGASPAQQGMFSCLIMSKAKDALSREEKISDYVAGRKAKRARHDWEDKEVLVDTVKVIKAAPVVEKPIAGPSKASKAKKRRGKEVAATGGDSEMADGTD